ncbi:aminomethyl transferase family protein [Streptomyces apocyni]|uniref:aminomethyl transferase family protein n=1 Tax=Streptomyces apocyni TaxID=2654677 RepID=UPI0012EAA146|nr:aminomethyl transferase family protein [Streptomyces apocyni]
MTATTVTVTPAAARTATDDYATLRTTVGAYRVTAPLVRLTGDDRLTHLDRFLTKSADFVEPDTAREVLALNADGTPFAILLHFEIGDETWLLPRTSVTDSELDTYLRQFETAAGVTVEISPEGWGATAFEGPLAWSVAAGLVDFDISGLPLHAVTEASPGVPGATAHLARVGTTGEYGYLLLSECPGTAHEMLLAAVSAQGGAEVGGAGLARVQAEAGMGVYGAGFGELAVGEADLAWMIDWSRIGEFHGSDGLTAPTGSDARLTALVAPAGSRFAAGTQLTASGQRVGIVLHQAPAARPDEELVLALLDAPFWVPGVELTATDEPGDARPLRTATLPRVVARSLTTKIA